MIVDARAQLTIDQSQTWYQNPRWRVVEHDRDGFIPCLMWSDIFSLSHYKIKEIARVRTSFPCPVNYPLPPPTPPPPPHSPLHETCDTLHCERQCTISAGHVIIILPNKASFLSSWYCTLHCHVFIISVTSDYREDASVLASAPIHTHNNTTNTCNTVISKVINFRTVHWALLWVTIRIADVPIWAFRFLMESKW